jgi:hypothetical protein
VVSGGVVAGLLGSERSSTLSFELLDWVAVQQSRREPESIQGANSTDAPSPASNAELAPLVAVESLPFVPRATLAPPEIQPMSAQLAPGFAAVGQFNADMTRNALEQAAARAQLCGSGPLTGTVLVTFSPEGRTKAVRFESVVGSPTSADCLRSVFRSVRVSPFHGHEVTVRKSFSVGS